jgi:hypothetical protein
MQRRRLKKVSLWFWLSLSLSSRARLSRPPCASDGRRQCRQQVSTCAFNSPAWPWGPGRRQRRAARGRKRRRRPGPSAPRPNSRPSSGGRPGRRARRPGGKPSCLLLLGRVCEGGGTDAGVMFWGERGMAGRRRRLCGGDERERDERRAAGGGRRQAAPDPRSLALSLSLSLSFSETSGIKTRQLAFVGLCVCASGLTSRGAPRLRPLSLALAPTESGEEGRRRAAKNVGACVCVLLQVQPPGDNNGKTSTS